MRVKGELHTHWPARTSLCLLFHLQTSSPAPARREQVVRCSAGKRWRPFSRPRGSGRGRGCCSWTQHQCLASSIMRITKVSICNSSSPLGFRVVLASLIFSRAPGCWKRPLGFREWCSCRERKNQWTERERRNTLEEDISWKIIALEEKIDQATVFNLVFVFHTTLYVWENLFCEQN